MLGVLSLTVCFLYGKLRILQLLSKRFPTLHIFVSLITEPGKLLLQSLGSRAALCSLVCQLVDLVVQLIDLCFKLLILLV